MPIDTPQEKTQYLISALLNVPVENIPFGVDVIEVQPGEWEIILSANAQNAAEIVAFEKALNNPSLLLSKQTYEVNVGKPHSEEKRPEFDNLSLVSEEKRPEFSSLPPAIEFTPGIAKDIMDMLFASTVTDDISFNWKSASEENGILYRERDITTHTDKQKVEAWKKEIELLQSILSHAPKEDLAQAVARDPAQRKPLSEKRFNSLSEEARQHPRGLFNIPQKILSWRSYQKDDQEKFVVTFDCESLLRAFHAPRFERLPSSTVQKTQYRIKFTDFVNYVCTIVGQKCIVQTNADGQSRLVFVENDRRVQQKNRGSLMIDCSASMTTVFRDFKRRVFPLFFQQLLKRFRSETILQLDDFSTMPEEPHNRKEKEYSCEQVTQLLTAFERLETNGSTYFNGTFLQVINDLENATKEEGANPFLFLVTDGCDTYHNAEQIEAVKKKLEGWMKSDNPPVILILNINTYQYSTPLASYYQKEIDEHQQTLKDFAKVADTEIVNINVATNGELEINEEEVGHLFTKLSHINKCSTLLRFVQEGIDSRMTRLYDGFVAVGPVFNVAQPVMVNDVPYTLRRKAQTQTAQASSSFGRVLPQLGGVGVAPSSDASATVAPASSSSQPVTRALAPVANQTTPEERPPVRLSR